MMRKVELNYEIIRRHGNINRLENFPSIHSLTISGKNLNPRHIIDIARNKNFTEICLYDCNIGNEGAKNISKSKTIKNLDVTRCEIGDDGAMELATNKVIKTLGISDNQITENGAGYFTSSSSIELIDLSHNPIRSISIVDQLKDAGKKVKSDGIPSKAFRP